MKRKCKICKKTKDIKHYHKRDKKYGGNGYQFICNKCKQPLNAISNKARIKRRPDSNAIRKAQQEGCRIDYDDTRIIKLYKKVMGINKRTKDKTKQKVIHHKIPLSQGGSHSFDNLEVMTRSDHTRHHRKLSTGNSITINNTNINIDKVLVIYYKKYNDKIKKQAQKK